MRTDHKRAASQNMPDHRLGEQDLVGDELLVPCAHATHPQHPCMTGREGHHTDWGLGEGCTSLCALWESGSKRTPAEWVSGETPDAFFTRKNHVRKS